MSIFVRRQSGGADLHLKILPLSWLKCTKVNTIGNSVMFEQYMATRFIKSVQSLLFEYVRLTSAERLVALVAKLNASSSKAIIREATTGHGNTHGQ